MPYPDSMVHLIEAFAKLPGVGRRTAERFAFHILSAPPQEVETLSKLLSKVNANIRYCRDCFNLSEGEICHICDDAARDHSVLCVVENPKDVIAIEKSGNYTGVYHVLLGTLSPLEGIGPKDLKIKELADRIHQGGVKEVILGTSSDTDGDTTALYLAKILKNTKVKVTRIAHGVPVGSALEFVDKATLYRAFKQRQELS